MTTRSNSTLSLYSTCPPGLGDGGCQEATCNSTFVSPAQRSLKPQAAQACAACDDGFTGLNCNICRGVTSCAARQQAVGRGISGTQTSSPASGQLVTSSVNHTLACDNQPAPVSASFYQCDIDQPTLSALAPGNLLLTGINVGDVPDFNATGLSEWDAKPNTTLVTVWLDGIQQFSCQADACSFSNITTPVSGSRGQFGSSQWSCNNLKCSCTLGTKICSNPGLPLGNIINSLGGDLDLPCHYVDPSNPDGSTTCAFSNPTLNSFVGPSGLDLQNCRFGQCLPQRELDQSWQESSVAKEVAAGKQLSGGVIAGLVVLGLAALLLISVVILGVILRRRAARRPRSAPTKAVGLSWDAITYKASSRRVPKWAQGKNVDLRDLSSPAAEKGEEASMRGWELTKLSANHGKTPRQASSPARSANILNNVSSRAEPGSLTYIMGPSGSGKTTLVDILAGRLKSGSVAGNMSWLSEENVNISATDAQRQIAFVDQDDSVCLPAFLTVREALQFAATLGTQENVPKQEREATVDEVLRTLGLEDIAHNRIGDARKRGISGGERRRVSLGVAMVSRPKILIADECTSGLDAVSAYRVVQALRQLASGSTTGTTVILTVHQPSSQVFHMADRAIMLTEGAIVFDDAPSKALDYCSRQGLPVAAGYNVADTLLSLAFRDTTRGTPASHDTEEDSASEAVVQNDAARRTSSQKSGCGSAETSHWTHSPLSINHGGDRPVTTFMTQLSALLGRSALMTKREIVGATAHIVGTTVIAILIGGCFYQVQRDLGGFQNRVGSMFFIYILILFMGLSAITVFSKARLLMMRERASGFYSPWSWVASHLVYDLILLRAIPSILLVAIVYWMVGLRHSAANFFQFLLITVIFNWVIAVYGMTLAALIEDVSVAILMGALFVLFNLGFAGFIMNHASTPDAISWLRWIAPTKYALEAVASNELSGLLLEDNISGVPVRVQVSIFTQKLFGFEPNSYYRDLIVLSCGFLVGYSLILFVAVWWRMREVR